jgi:hypothetical protein
VRSRRLLLVAIFATLLAVTAVTLRSMGGARAEVPSELVAQPALGAPAETMLGASPNEAPGEVWATASKGQRLARYTEAGGWEVLPAPVDTEGNSISGVVIPTGAAVGRTTPAGGVLVAAEAGGRKILLERDPGGALREVPEPGSLPVEKEAAEKEKEAVEKEALEKEKEAAEKEKAELEETGESAEEGAGKESPAEGVVEEEKVPVEFFGTTPHLAAFEAPGGRTGFYVAPVPPPLPAGEKLTNQSVLEFDGEQWSEGKICMAEVAAPECKAPLAAFRVLAIEATPQGEGWLLGRAGKTGQPLQLFAHEPDGTWRQRPFGTAAPGSMLEKTSPGGGISVSARTLGQQLTVTSEGVWIDALLKAGVQGSDVTFFYNAAAREVTGSWCDVTALAGLCTRPLGAELPTGDYRSFAWTGGGPFGQRVITGVGQGAILTLEGEGFRRQALLGGSAGSEYGAALSAPDAGWLGTKPPQPPLQLVHLGVSPEPTALQPWPVPFRHPLLALAGQPGTEPGGLESQALAVGVDGQVARYLPGRGWEGEFLLNSLGRRVHTNLRAVAWPEPGFAYAVGDEAEMWMWRGGTGLWEPDPGKPPNLARANFTGIAFDPSEPTRGYAVGKQGVLLGFGREWTQEALPEGINPEVNFTSIAFAGTEAIATYKFPKLGQGEYSGGAIVNDGEGWRVEPVLQAALEGEAPELVSGLPDGGAAIATSGQFGHAEILERSAPGGPWLSAPGEFVGESFSFPTALAAFREGGQLRAVVSFEQRGSGVGSLEASWLVDEAQILGQPAPGQAPLLTAPYPLPGSTFVLRQTSSGWQDEQHEALANPEPIAGQTETDLPARPDPVLALLLNGDGSGGWAVGGVTGEESLSEREEIQTAGVLRYGTAAAAPANAGAAPIPLESGAATFAVAGDAHCAGPCADLAGTGIGPVRWSKSAVADVAAQGGGPIRAFLYSGPGLAEKVGGFGYGSTLSPFAFTREESAYANRLGAEAGALPVFAAPSRTDLDRANGLTTFLGAFSGYSQPLGQAGPGAGIAPHEPAIGHGYYSFDSSGSSGPTVRVIVLDYAQPTLEASSKGQQCWLATELERARAAHVPAIVLGERDLAGLGSNEAADSSEVTRILVGGAPPSGCLVSEPGPASAYFFDFPEENREYRLSSGGASIPAFGSGTLGYTFPPQSNSRQYLGASGYLLASVGQPDPTTNVAPVNARLIPAIGSLALAATDGTLLRRSQTALFEGLARRPQAGDRCTNAPGCVISPDPYVPVPSECTGPNCATGILPEYEFTSSKPDVANFVEVNPASTEADAVLLVNEKTVADPHSGLLCAFNAGTTTVTVSTGGLTYSEPVTVQPGSVQQPCGTVPLTEKQETSVEPLPVEPLEQGGGPEFEKPEHLPPPPPPPAPIHHLIPQTHTLPRPNVPHPVKPPKPAPVSPPIPFFNNAPQIIPRTVIVPPPPPPAVEPTPPSGTSPVTQPATSPEPQEEEEVAIEHVHHAVAAELASHRLTVGREASAGSHGIGVGKLVPLFVLLAALAGVAARPRRRPEVAPVTSRQRKNRS